MDSEVDHEKQEIVVKTSNKKYYKRIGILVILVLKEASRALTSCKPAAVLLAWAAPGSGWLWMALRRYGTLGTITLRMECVLRSHTFAARAARPVNAVTVAKGPVLSGVLKCSKCCNTVATLQ